MAKQHLEKYLTREPTIISENIWYYHESRGVNLVVQVKEGENYIKTIQVDIPWENIKTALENYEKAKLKQAKKLKG